MKCFLCGSDSWRQLPVPADARSITTSGIAICESLEREQCMSCGFLQKSGGNFLGNSRFYEEQYENYYGRPGVQRYDSARYTAMAEWMKSALGKFTPRSILDVGCGAGWSMAATAALYADATIEGVEPSVGNADRARRAGFTVHSMRLRSSPALLKHYDLIYSNNVLQHVVDPIEFLSNVSRQLSPKGRVVLILPDAAEPSNEMLWCDHNFSFRATDMARLAQCTDLEITNWQPNPANNTLLNKQLVVLQKCDVAAVKTNLPQDLYLVEELFKRRAEYFMKWRSLDGELVQRIAGLNRVFNFGGSMWTWLLAGYCPSYWNNIEACLVDGERGQCIGKRVIPTSEIPLSDSDGIVLGINPVNQTIFADKLQSRGARVITWSDWIFL